MERGYSEEGGTSPPPSPPPPLPLNRIHDEGHAAAPSAIEVDGSRETGEYCPDQTRPRPGRTSVSVSSTASVFARMSTGGGPLRKEIRRLLRADSVRLWDPPYLLEDGTPNYELLSDLCVTYAELLDSDDIEGIMECLEHIQINAVMRQLERLGVDLQGRSSISPPSEVPVASPPPPPPDDDSPPPPIEAPPSPPARPPSGLSDADADAEQADPTASNAGGGDDSRDQNLLDSTSVRLPDARLLSYLGAIPSEAPIIPPRPRNTFDQAAPILPPTDWDADEPDGHRAVLDSPDEWPNPPMPTPPPAKDPDSTPAAPRTANITGGAAAAGLLSPDEGSESETEELAAVSYGAGLPVESDSDSDGWGFEFDDAQVVPLRENIANSDSDDDETCIDDAVGPAGSAVPDAGGSAVSGEEGSAAVLGEESRDVDRDVANELGEYLAAAGYANEIHVDGHTAESCMLPDDGQRTTADSAEGCEVAAHTYPPPHLDLGDDDEVPAIQVCSREHYFDGGTEDDIDFDGAIPADPANISRTESAPVVPEVSSHRKVPPQPPRRTISVTLQPRNGTADAPKIAVASPTKTLPPADAIHSIPPPTAHLTLNSNPTPALATTKVAFASPSTQRPGDSEASPHSRTAHARRVAKAKSSVASMVKKTGRLQMATALTQTKQNQTTVCRLKWHSHHITLKGNFLLLKKLPQSDRSDKLEDLSVKNADKQYLIDGCLAERLSDCVVTVALSSGDALQLKASGSLIASAWELALNRAAGVLEAKYSDPAECRKVLNVRIANHREALGRAKDACSHAKDTSKHQRNAALWRYEMELLTIFRLGKYAAAVDGSVGDGSLALIEQGISERTRGLLNELGETGLNSSGLYLILGPNGTGRVKKNRRSILMGSRRQSASAIRRSGAGKGGSPATSPEMSHVDGRSSNESPGDRHLVKITCTVDFTSTFIPREPEMTSQMAITAVVQRREDERNARCWYLEEVGSTGVHRPLQLEDQLADGVTYELHLKPVHDINMTRSHHSTFGFTLIEDVSGVVRVTDVESNSIALVNGLRRGDEVVTVNGESASGRLADVIDQLKTEIQTSVQIRPADELAVKASADKKREIDVMVTAMHLAPPPQQSVTLNDDHFADLVLPSPEHFGLVNDSTPVRASSLREGAHVGTDSQVDTEAMLSVLVSSSAQTKVLSDEMRLLISKPAQKRWQLQARIEELVLTEVDYVRDLRTFMERFVEPVLTESFVKKNEKALIRACRFDRLIQFHETFLRALQLSLPENAPSKYNERARHISVSSAESPDSTHRVCNGAGFTQADIPEYSPDVGSDMSFMSVRADASYLSTTSERRQGAESGFTDNLPEHSTYDAVNAMQSWDRPKQSVEERALEGRGPGSRVRASASLPPSTAARVDDSPYVKVGASLFAVADVFLASIGQLREVYSDFITFRRPSSVILSAKRNLGLDAFLRNRNPGKDIVELVDWYMIKPVQRVTKYPLLLSAMTDALRKDVMFTGTVQPLIDAAEQMKNAVIQINEMQKVGEAILTGAPNLLVRCTSKRIFATFVWINAVDDKGRAVRKSDTSMVNVVVYPEHIVVLLCSKREYRFIGTLDVKDATFTTDLTGQSLTTKQLKLHKDTGWVLRPREPNHASSGAPSQQQYALVCTSADSRRTFLHSLQKLIDRSAKNQKNHRASGIQAGFQV